MMRIILKNQQKWLFFVAIVFMMIAIVSMSQLSSQAVVQREIRGVWLTNVDSDILFSQENLEAGLDRLDSLNFNTVYPTIWQGGYTLYPSQVAQATFGQQLDPNPALQERDMLQEVITAGHERGLTVIPWFEFGFMTTADSELVRRHPDWLTQRQDGTRIKKAGEHEWVWLNPFHPEVQDFILDLVVEVVSNYDVDGIQFDDHFGLPVEFGYDPYTVGLYEQELQGLTPSDNPQETFWVRWRADKINQFMERVFYRIKAANPDCLVSLSPNPLHFALPAYLQDWFTWERKGWIEEIVLQVYRPDLDRFITELERTEVQLAKNHIPVAIGILSGLKDRPTPMSTIKQQVEAVRDRDFAGVSFFFYESLWKWSEESPLTRMRQLRNLFPHPVPRPNLETF
jgi:uncharacterized lipoprotein YddW (UPF0748 family)